MIDYNVTKFEPITMLDVFKRAKSLNIRECVWQLGTNSLQLSGEMSLQKYADDLKTLNVLCESFKYDHQFECSVAAAYAAYADHHQKPSYYVEGYDFGR